MFKKLLVLALLASFQIQTAPEATEFSAEDVEFLAANMPEESQEDVVRGTKSKKFCNLTATCAKIRSLIVYGNADIRGNLTVEGTTTIASPVTISAPVTVTAPIAVVGAPLTIGNCTLTCNNGVLTITSNGTSAAVGTALGYGYIYNLTPIASVGVETAIPFDSNGPLQGVTHTAGSASVGIVSAGTYSITFSVSGSGPNQFALFVNGVANTSTVYGSGAGTQQNTGQAIVTLGAGDVITLVNHTSAAGVILAPNVGGTQTNVNASILIVRLA